MEAAEFLWKFGARLKNYVAPRPKGRYLYRNTAFKRNEVIRNFELLSREIMGELYFAQPLLLIADPSGRAV